LVTLLLYALLLVSPMATLADVYGQVQNTRGSAQRILEFLAQQREPADTGKRTVKALKGDIKFEDVSFGYQSRAGVLQGLNLEINAGETVAITGPNGVGKSTLAHLLLRFSDPDMGRITVDGYDLREVTLTSLRAHIGLVAQHILLLNGSVAENISYGMPAAGRHAIEQAANKAHADTFIGQLPEKYDTIIGDQGVKLSGGQRQRLSLARALLKDPPILILDEATAMFDPAAEQAFIKTCHDFLAPRTVILITHRPASLALADRVINLAEASSGPHA
jgi:ABC-type multidrug transport system fused ATPase/permease subunit